MVYAAQRDLLHTSGMGGWFGQEMHLLFCAFFGAATLPFYAMGLWGNHHEGRVGKIIDHAIHKQRPFLTTYFHSFQPLKCMVAEVKCVHDPTLLPAVFVSHCMDNSFIALPNVPPDLLDVVCSYLHIFHANVPFVHLTFE